ncbi:DUF4080 domain-containing protein [Kiritimatiellota bacterium B12222]|nr:DUF4080 domain-containing protein [Kiritimatiellota bacterium B12222]
MSDIVLTTLNARYVHCALSLRCLQVNLKELQASSQICEFVLNRPLDEVVAELLAFRPKMILVSVYIWNVDKTLLMLQALRKAAPELTLVLGGPEVSYSPLYPGIEEAADYIVTGEGEVTGYELCRRLMDGDPPASKFLVGEQADVTTTKMPYDLYTDNDVAHRIIYVETSRGCPYRCEYCLSSLDRQVRFFPLDELLAGFQQLLDRGVLLFKLLDRTFNTKIDRAVSILEFFLENWRPGLTIHCELIPDRIPDPLKACFQKFPAGTLQFEVGVQSFNQEILDRIQRAQVAEKVEENIAWLCEHSQAVIHADLIFGLPGEELESIQDSFNRLVVLEPDQIQLNLLKLLKGTPIARHTDPFKMVYDNEPPFEIQETSTIDRDCMQQLREFSRVWTLFHNQEKLKTSLPYVWRDREDPFEAFMAFTRFVKRHCDKLYGISLTRQVQLLDEWLTLNCFDTQRAKQRLLADFADEGRRKIPGFLRV